MDAKDLAPAAREAAFSELEASVGLALETYANVHRGTGYNSMASTLLFERARHEILNARGLDRRRYTVIFCTPARAAALAAAVGPERPVVLSSQDVGLPLGLRAVIAGRESFPKGVPFQTGGGTVRMVSRRSVVWEGAPDRFEAGTPAVVNAVAFARALGLARGFGIRRFGPDPRQAATPSEILHHDELLGYSGRELLRRLQRSTIGRGRPVPTTGGVLPYVHLDNAASMPTFEAVWSAVRKTWRLPEDRRAELVAGVRSLCAGFFGAPADRYEVVFTSNATEAINVAARALVGTPSWGQSHDPGCETVVLNTSAEHNSNELPWRFADGVSLVRVPVDNEGFPDLTAMERLLKEYNADRVHGRKRVRVVAMSGASNVLGACPDLVEIGRIAHRYGALAFVDAAQLAGHRAIRMAADGLDGLAFSGHKMYAPFGTGGLILRKELWPAADAACRAARESGDENVAGVAALGKAIVLLERVGMAVVEDEESRLTGMTLRALRSVPDVEIYGLSDPDSPRLARRIGVISFGFRHVPHNLAAAELSEEAGIGVRTGCHCAQILVKTLLRINSAREASASLGSRLVPGITKSLLPGLVRVSFGLENDEADLRRLVGAVEKIASRRRSLVLRLLAKARHAAPVMPETETCGRMRTAMEWEASSVYGPAQAGSAEARSESPVQPGRRVPSEGAALLRQPCCRKL